MYFGDVIYVNVGDNVQYWQIEMVFVIIQGFLVFFGLFNMVVIDIGMIFIGGFEFVVVFIYVKIFGF